MSTAVASIPQGLPGGRPQHDASPKATYPTLAPSNPLSSPSQQPPTERILSAGSATPNAAVVVAEGAAQRRISPDGAENRSPHSARQPPKIIVKKEPPSSPEVPATARHRPRKLDLSSSNQGAMTSRPSAPLTAREPGSLGMHDVGIACLSPGFKTQDPNMREHIQRSISVRDQQRQLIESRLQKTARPGTDANAERSEVNNPFASGLKTPATSSKKRPPPGLSIVPPSHEQFAHERVIQSAPLHASFPGRHVHPLTRHIQNQPSNLSNTSHIHQTSNRLPPIADVFAGDVAGEGLGSGREHPGTGTRNGFPHQAASQHRPASGAPLPSPGLPPPSSAAHHPGGGGNGTSSRTREYRSAEEAVQDMAGGREDLLPKIVHYRSSNHTQQPPTPPSPTSHANGGGGGANLTPNKLGPPHMHHHHPSSSSAAPHHPQQQQQQHLPSQQQQQQQQQPPPPTLHSQGGMPTHQLATQHAHLNGESHSNSPALGRGFGGNNNNNNGGGRRRGRMEYERDAGSPPLGSGPDYPRRTGGGGMFGEGRDSPESQRRKKEEFLGLCARAWDLMHS